MTARLLSIGTAVPRARLSQEDAESLSLRLGAGRDRERAVRAVFRRSGVGSRGVAIAGGDGAIDFYEKTDAGPPTTGARMARYLAAASDLARRACAGALARAETRAADITHVVTVSCTGFAAPGVEQALIASLGLPADVARANIGFMGCHGAVNGLRVAKAFAESDPRARVLLCCAEVSSLHFQQSSDPAAAVPNALFADGAAAAVIGACGVARGVALRGTAGAVFPDSSSCMSWRIGDHGFEMTLSPRVPEVVASSVGPWVDGVLDGMGLSRADIRGWAIHPGGPRVLSSVRDALGVREASCEASRGVLFEHGNMSSATVLFIADRLLRRGDAVPMMGLAFGPGLCGEAFVLG